jgi:hypothetical protein
MQITKNLLKRAKRKYLNFPVLKHLIALESPLKSRYESTLYCSSRITVKEGKVSSRYCKRTWCNICQPIRSAIRINNYREQLESFGDLQLTTLTSPNCSAGEIRSSVNHFRKIFRQFRNTYKKSHGIHVRGVYNFEFTYNSVSRSYHPHIHIIHEKIDSWKTGRNTKEGGAQEVNAIIEYWIRKNAGRCSIRAQDCRKCFDIIEGFKYQSLSVFKLKFNGKSKSYVPAYELDQIYQAIAGLRCFQPFGISKIVPDKVEDSQFDKLEAYETEAPEGDYSWRGEDWHQFINCDPDTGELVHHLSDSNIVTEFKLSGFTPNKKLKNLFNDLYENSFYISGRKTLLHHEKNVRSNILFDQFKNHPPPV